MRQVSRPEGFANVGYRMSIPRLVAATREETKAQTRHAPSRLGLRPLRDGQGRPGRLPRLRWWHDVQMKSVGSPLSPRPGRHGPRPDGRQQLAPAQASPRPRAALGYKEEYDWYQSPLRDLAAMVSLAI